jgi:bifunctional UDP-N-acetylglucosamine pyrophosphorylase/glucosamine-1-phosphate N-acetyltransferase
VDAALTGLAEVSGDTVLLCCGDVVTTRETLQGVIEAFQTRRAEALVLVAECPRGLTASWTTVDAAPDGLVRGVWGRGGPDHPRFGGVAAARTETFQRYLARNPGILLNVHVGSMPPPEGDLAYTFELMRLDGIEVHSVMARDFFVDVDKPWHILEANYQAARHALAALDKTVISAGATIDNGAEIADDAKVWLGPGAYIGKGCHLRGSAILGAGAGVTTGAILDGNVVVGDHTQCEEYCKVGGGSVLGPGGIVGHCAEFEGVTFDVVYLCHYACITAIIGTHVDIGAATVCGTWRFDDGTKTQVVRQHKETPECFGSFTYIGDYCRTGVNATLMPGVKIGFYSCVGGGAVVYDDVPERTMLLPKQEHVLKAWGPEQYGW